MGLAQPFKVEIKHFSVMQPLEHCRAGVLGRGITKLVRPGNCTHQALPQQGFKSKWVWCRAMRNPGESRPFSSRAGRCFLTASLD